MTWEKTPSDVTVEIVQTALLAAKEGSSGQDSLSQAAGIRQRRMLLHDSTRRLVVQYWRANLFPKRNFALEAQLGGRCGTAGHVRCVDVFRMTGELLREKLPYVKG